MDTSGTPYTERAALLQTECANHESLRGTIINVAVIQILHTDKEIYYEPQRRRSRDKTTIPCKQRDKTTIPCKQNLLLFNSDQRQVSIWMPLCRKDEILSFKFVCYLRSHKIALDLWLQMARHYQPMRRFYIHCRTQDKHLAHRNSSSSGFGLATRLSRVVCS